MSRINHSPTPGNAPIPPWQGFVYPLLSTVAFYLAFTLPLPYQYGLGGIGLLSLDFLLQLLLALVLFTLSRNTLLFVVVQAGLMALIYLSTPLKIVYFSGGPVTPYDLASAWALLHIVDPATRWLILVPLFGLSGLLLYNLRLSRRALFGLLLLAAALPPALEAASPALSQWFDNAYPTQPWRRGFNYAVRGPTVYLLHQTVKLLSEDKRVPSREAVAGAAAALDLAPARGGEQAPAARPRNLHLLLVESLWDPRQLPNLAQGPDPFDPAFRALWEQGGRSTVLSPVYGAGTANAEFELLCGLPVLSESIVFEHEIRNAALPCLPRLLQRRGYRTVAFHPNRADFWNRDFAFPRLGIGEYFTLPDFTLDELYGGRFLSDHSLLRQVREKLVGGATPVFDYTITIAEHEPYYPHPLRPSHGAWRSGSQELDHYLDVLHDGTAATAAHIAALRREDPRGLIVVLGDHSPLLGPNFEGYRAAGLMDRSGGRVDAATQVVLAGTPLLVIDGRRGPLKLGRLNLYELPARLLALLGLPDEMPLGPPGKAPLHYRPMAGLGMLVWGEGQAYQCDTAQRLPQCRDADDWRDAIQTLRLDLLRGGQYQLQF